MHCFTREEKLQMHLHTHTHTHTHTRCMRVHSACRHEAGSDTHNTGSLSLAHTLLPVDLGPAQVHRHSLPLTRCECTKGRLRMALSAASSCERGILHPCRRPHNGRLLAPRISISYAQTSSHQFCVNSAHFVRNMNHESRAPSEFDASRTCITRSIVDFGKPDGTRMTFAYNTFFLT
jgi:hypothetical protein